jgi:excisionase family DNA binding protein
MHTTRDLPRSALITSKELARLLRVPVTSVYGWRQHGTGPPAYRVGRHTRYRVDEVLAWLEQKKLATSTPRKREPGFDRAQGSRDDKNVDAEDTAA